MCRSVARLGSLGVDSTSNLAPRASRLPLLRVRRQNLARIHGGRCLSFVGELLEDKMQPSWPVQLGRGLDPNHQATANTQEAKVVCF